MVELPVVVAAASAVAWPVPSGLAVASAAGDAQACGPGDAIAGQLRAVLGGFLDEKACELAIIGPSLAPIAEEVRLLVDAGEAAAADIRVLGSPCSRAPTTMKQCSGRRLRSSSCTRSPAIHDDVMDRSVTRRGRPSAFAALAERHRRESRVGDSEWFGISAAMLVGDLAFVWADDLVDHRRRGAGLAQRAVRPGGERAEDRRWTRVTFLTVPRRPYAYDHNRDELSTTCRRPALRRPA